MTAVPKSRESWDNLRPETQSRYRRAGIDRDAYEGGAPIHITRARRASAGRPRRGIAKKSTDRGSGRA